MSRAQNRETLERTCYNLRDEVKELDGKVKLSSVFNFVLHKTKFCSSQVENFGMEVKDFEGAVKMQGAMMDKLASSRLPILPHKLPIPIQRSVSFS